MPKVVTKYLHIRHAGYLNYPTANGVTKSDDSPGPLTGDCTAMLSHCTEFT